MALEYANILQAMARVTHTAHGAGVCTFASNSGFTTAGSTHAAAGVYVLPLDVAVDPATSFAQANPSSGTDPTAFAAITGGGASVTVTVNEAGAASDADDFTVMVYAGPNSP
jgi:hypothetical protein